MKQSIIKWSKDSQIEVIDDCDVGNYLTSVTRVGRPSIVIIQLVEYENYEHGYF